MEEKEQIESVSGQTGGEDTASLIEAINTMKKTTVPRGDYEKLMETNRQLASAIVNGTAMPDVQHQEEEKQATDVNALRKTLMSTEGISNRKYAETVLELRDALIDAGQPDPFLPMGEGVSPTETERNNSNALAETLRYCVEQADGDDMAFDAAFARCVANEIRPTARRK